MRQKLKRYILALDDTALLVLYAACWLLALFAPSSNQLALVTSGRVLSAIAATMVVLFWINRPSFRLGWRWRDVWVVLLVGVAVWEACGATIRSVAFLDLLQRLELVALFVTAAYLCSRRPQPLFLTTVLLLAGATAFMWRWRAPLFPAFDPIVLAGITALTLLAVLPWLAVRWCRAWHRRYHWVVLVAALGLGTVQAATALAGNRDWLRSLPGILPAQTRQVVATILQDSWVTGCGAGHYEWLFRAQMPEDYAGEIATVPGALLFLVERGALGLGALILFGLGMLWRFRPGSWAAHHEEVMGLARPLRWVAAYVFVLFLATPALRSPLGEVILWSLLGMMRAWSSRHRPAAVWLVVQRPDEEVVRSVTVEQQRRWRQAFLTFGALLGGIALIFLHVRPLVGAFYRRFPREMTLNDAAYLDRLDLAQWWWPDDPRTDKLEAMHYRAKADAGKSLVRTEIEAVNQAYERMIQANPYDPLSYNTLATWYALQGDTKRAVEVTRRGLSDCPGSFELQYSLAGWYKRLGNLALARDAYERARLLRPHSLPVLRNLVELELRLGNTRQAKQYLQKALQIAPNDRGLNLMLEAIHSGQTAKILEQFDAGDKAEAAPSPASKDSRQGETPP